MKANVGFILYNAPRIVSCNPAPYLLMGFPQFEKAAEHADLRFLSIRQGLEDRVEFGDGGEGMGEGLVSEEEEGLDEHLYFGRIVDAVRHVVLAHRGIKFLTKNKTSSIHCCGSGSGIRCLSDPWIRGQQPGSYFRELRIQIHFLG